MFYENVPNKRNAKRGHVGPTKKNPAAFFGLSSIFVKETCSLRARGDLPTR